MSRSRTTLPAAIARAAVPIRSRVAPRRLLGVAALLGALSSVATADVRVLLAFDAAGHRVHQVTRAGSRDDNLTTYVAPPADPGAAALAGEASLEWLAADGRTLAIERVPDPRVGHAPAPGGDDAAISPGTPVALPEGGWLARGPDDAMTLLLNLPDVPAAGLVAERWRLALDGDLLPGR